MTLGEVLAWQDRIDAASISEAAGRYQILEDTLRRLARDLALPMDARFDADLQDRLAGRLLDEAGWRDFRAGRIGAPAFGNRLAGIWAALPLLAGPDRGRSRHRGTAGNRARIGADAMLARLEALGPARTSAPRGRTAVIHDLPPGRATWARDPWRWD